MKKLLYLLLPILVIISCSKENDDFNLTPTYLTGQWKMISFQNISLNDESVTDFDLSEYPDYYLNINDTGLAVFNTPCYNCYKPTVEEEYTLVYKVIDGVLHVKDYILAPSGLIDPSGFELFIPVPHYFPIENAFDNEGRLYIRVEIPELYVNTETGEHEGQVTNIRIFEKAN